MTPFFTGQLAAIGTAACWAQNSVVYSLAGQRVGSRAVTHIRLWIALPFILMINFLINGSFIPAAASLNAYLFLAASGVLGFWITDRCLFKAFVDIGPRETLVIMCLTPIISALMSWLFQNETLQAVQIIGIVTSVSGVAWVVASETRGKEKAKKKRSGVVAALLGASLQAATMVLAKQGAPQGANAVSANAIRIMFGLIGISSFALLRRQARDDVRGMRDRIALAQITSGALIGPVLGMVMAIHAFKTIPMGVAMALIQMAPVLLLPFEMLYFRKRVPLQAVVGTLLAFLGAALLLYSTS